MSRRVPGPEREALLNSIMTRVDVALEPPLTRDPRIPNTLFRISFTDHDRQTALKVVDMLLNSFVEDTIGSDRNGTASAQRFLKEQLTDYGRRLADAENQLAEFKKKNLGLVPGDEGGYFARLTTEAQEVKRLQSALSVANSRTSGLQRQLRGETPFVPPTDTGSRHSFDEWREQRVRRTPRLASRRRNRAWTICCFDTPRDILKSLRPRKRWKL